METNPITIFDSFTQLQDLIKIDHTMNISCKI